MIQQDATNAGYPVAPGAIAVKAPPPPLLTGANLTAVVQQQASTATGGVGAYPPPIGNICMIQKGRPSNRSQKLITRRMNLAETFPPATPEYLD